MGDPRGPSVHPGEVANLIKIVRLSMKDQGSPPHKIAESAKMLCEQYGIRLPIDFVKAPEFEQLKLFPVADAAS